MRRPLVVAAVFALAAAPAPAQQGAGAAHDSAVYARRTYVAVRLHGAPAVIDGKLDDPAWQQANVASEFVQYAPDPGSPSRERTEARLLSDDDAIYVAMRMWDDHPDSIAGQLARRDLTGAFSDWAHVTIDSYHARRTAFRFALNPRGVKKDVLHSNDNNEDLTWDRSGRASRASTRAGGTPSSGSLSSR